MSVTLSHHENNQCKHTHTHTGSALFNVHTAFRYQNNQMHTNAQETYSYAAHVAYARPLACPPNAGTCLLLDEEIEIGTESANETGRGTGETGKRSGTAAKAGLGLPRTGNAIVAVAVTVATVMIAIEKGIERGIESETGQKRGTRVGVTKGTGKRGTMWLFIEAVVTV